MTFLDKKIDHHKHATGILTLTLKGQLVGVNTQYLAMTGFIKEELLGKNIEIIDSNSSQKILSKESVDFGCYQSILTRKDNSHFPVEIYYFHQQAQKSDQIILFIQEINYVELAKDSIIEQIFEQTNKAIMVTDNKGCVQRVNKNFLALTDKSEIDIIGKIPVLLKLGLQKQHFYEKFWRQIIDKGTWQGEIWNKRKNGEIYPEWLNISSIRSSNGHVSHYICQFTDITNQKKSEEQQLFHANHDTLTGLPNRQLLFEKLDDLCVNNEAKETFFAVLFCDLDRFKMINDSLGHNVGDELLKAVASRFEVNIDNHDIIARTGGDEFIAVIEGEKALNNINNICTQILSLFEKPFHTKYGEFKLTMSIGVSQFPVDSKDVRELISFADTAMFEVKKSGGNHYSLFNVTDKSLIQQRLTLESKIDAAMAKDQFEVWYQPQVNAKTYEVYGVECLIRWNDPEQGLISPNLFIPIAEAKGSIKELGYFVLKSACHQLKQWRVNDIFRGTLAINVSLRQFERNDLLVQIKQTLIDERLPPTCLELEVTESLFSGKDNYHTPILCELRELGVKVAIDDFGTGYSSLQRLKDLPIDNIKIDKCFIDNIENSPEDVAIVQATILLSKTFNVDLIAEGIETQAQADKLCELGCCNQQGYLYSKPLRAHDFEIWLAEFILKHENIPSLKIITNL